MRGGSPCQGLLDAEFGSPRVKDGPQGGKRDTEGGGLHRADEGCRGVVRLYPPPPPTHTTQPGGARANTCVLC